MLRAFKVMSVIGAVLALTATSAAAALPEDREYAVPHDREYAVPTDREYAVPQDREYAVPTDREYVVPTDREYAVPTDREYAVPTDRGYRHHDRCEREFDRAARRDMVAFRDYDAETWRDMHHPDAETVLASGHRFVGVDAIMRALNAHFRDREAVFTWTELSRFVDRTCTLGMVVYETRYHVPSTGFDQRTTTTVTFVRERGEWLVLFDQGTELPS